MPEWPQTLGNSSNCAGKYLFQELSNHDNGMRNMVHINQILINLLLNFYFHKHLSYCHTEQEVVLDTWTCFVSIWILSCNSQNGQEVSMCGYVSRTKTSKEWDLNSSFSIYYEALRNSFGKLIYPVSFCSTTKPEF